MSNQQNDIYNEHQYESLPQVGDKWNSLRTVVEVTDTYVATAELFANGKPKKTTILIHSFSGALGKGY